MCLSIIDKFIPGFSLYLAYSNWENNFIFLYDFIRTIFGIGILFFFFNSKKIAPPKMFFFICFLKWSKNIWIKSWPLQDTLSFCWYLYLVYLKIITYHLFVLFDLWYQNYKIKFFTNQNSKSKSKFFSFEQTKSASKIFRLELIFLWAKFFS